MADGVNHLTGGFNRVYLRCLQSHESLVYSRFLVQTGRTARSPNTPILLTL